MAARFSASGKRIGRPPGSGKTQQAPAATPVAMPNADLFEPASADTQALAVGRAMIAFANRYDAAGRGRRMASWNAPSSGPNTALTGLQTIRDRSRDSVRNDWASESVVQKWTTTLIGVGITPRFSRVKNRTRKQEVLDLWADFVRQADADGVLDLYGLQTLITRSWFESGEVFVRRRPRFLDEGFRTPMQVQVLEADMVPLLDATTFEGLPVNHVIRSGIEFNKRGRRVAYWFYKSHPSDDTTAQAMMNDPSALVRILAADVCHVFEPKRPGQLRGVPVVAPVLAHLRSVSDYVDITLERQKIANLWVGFITRGLPQLGAEDVNSLTGLANIMSDETPLIPLKPGLLQELEDGQNVTFANPPEAGTTYSDYLRTSHLGTAAGNHLPYELFSGDLQNVSDRTLRVAINEYRRFAESRQWQILIPQCCQRIVEWVVDAWVLAGLAGMDEMDDLRRVQHSPHGWAHIHPVQDPQGKKLEVEAGFRSRSSVVGERGDDAELVDEERRDDDKREQTLKIGPYSQASVAATAPAGGQSGTGKQDNGDTDGIDNNEYSSPPTAP